MKKSSLEKSIESGVDLLSAFIPKKTHLYFPLLSATVVWALRQAEEWKKKIFSWKIWLDPDYVQTKSDEFVLEFFESQDALMKVWREEIEMRKLDSLREAFRCLYPLLGLEDPFLLALFAKEIEEEDYRGIVKSFDKVVSQTRKDIGSAEREKELLRELESFGKTALSLKLHLISQAKLRKIISEIVERLITEKND